MLRNLKLLVLLSLVAFSTWGQEFKFSHFNIKDGLNDPFVYAIANDSRGYLCIGTGEGLGVFDGQKFQMKYAKDGLAEDFVSALYLSSNNALWIGHKEGGLSTLNNSEISVLNTDLKIESVITGITEDTVGTIWISSQSQGLITADLNDKTTLVSGFENKIINDIYISSRNVLYVSTDMGLEIYNINANGVEYASGKLEFLNVVKVISWDNDRLLIGTSSSGLYQYDVVKKLIQQIEIPDDVIIKDISIDQEKNISVSTINQGLLKIDADYQVTVYNTDNGLTTNAINQTFTDREGIQWIGSYGEGLFKHDNEIFTNYYSVKEGEVGDVYDLHIDDRYKYFLYDTCVIRVNQEGFNNPDTFQIKGVKGLNSIWVNEIYQMYIGTNNNGVYKVNPSTSEYEEITYSKDVLSLNVSDVVGGNGSLWIGTFNGVFKVPFGGEPTIKYDISAGLSHNSINSLFYDKSTERLYIGCKSSKLNFIDKTGEVQEISYFESTKVYNIYDIDTDANDQLVIATYGDGLLIQNDDLFYSVSSVNGLLSNFCYAITTDINNDVWITHNGGLSKLDLSTGNLKVYSEKESVSYRYNQGAITRDHDFVWFGNATGVLKFDASVEDGNDIAPSIHIQSIMIDGEERKLSNKIELKFGYYDIKFVAKGLSLKSPEKVTYKFKLEGYNQDWTDISTDNRFNLGQVADGEYKLKVVAFNEGMVGSSEDVVFVTIVIRAPFWKKIWFWLLIGVGVLVITYGVIRYREVKYKLRQAELEEQLEIRTKEVTEQKDKVMSINKDITDSINYAKRIQDAVLPDDKKFEQKFPNSFVIYKPRDIVSGDFYWTNSTTDKLVLGCGDCTGHGVPGAFMSLLGQQMLKEIYSIKHIESPDEILHELNLEIRKLMSEESADLDDYLMVDGMDIIITEFDFEKMILNWSSAIRPLVRYRNGQRDYLKGSRNSIGSATTSAVFDLNTVKLEKGDIIYVFSDGFPDQFGGPNYKKLKTSGMFKILDEAQKMPIDAQKAYIENKLNTWMADTEQTDDIIIIGVQV